MPVPDDALQQCQKIIKYRFADVSLLTTALTHSSISNQRIDSNERLEFLGDAVLGIIICEELYRRFPQQLEGDLTIRKSAVVSRRTCARVAGKLGLAGFLSLGKGISEEQDLPESLSAAVLEAIVGAIYLDGGLKKARSFVVRYFEPFMKLAEAEQHYRDYKSMLQQYAQGECGSSPSYELLDEKGPDHAKAFEVCASMLIAGQTHTFPPAWGISKKEAEQKAAKMALEELGVLEKSAYLEDLETETSQ